MAEVVEAKNNDYSNGGEFFSNFKFVERYKVTSVEKGFLVRMLDKVSRLASLIAEEKEIKVKDEKIEDTLLDLANYSILLATYIKHKNESRR